MASSSASTDIWPRYCVLDVAGMVDDGAELLRNRQLRAQATLDAIGQVSVGVGEIHKPLLLPQDGDGWCFFRSVRAEINMPDTASLAELCMLALWHIATNRKEWAAYFVPDEHTEQRRSALRQWQADVPALWDLNIDVLQPLDLYLLDLSTCLARGDLSSERSYADHCLVQSLMDFFGLRAMVIEYNDPNRRTFVPDMRVESEQHAFASADVCIIHYSVGAYQHYDAIQRRDGKALGLSPHQQASVLTTLRDCTYPIELVHAPVEHILHRMICLLQWQEFLRLGAKFHIPVVQPLAEVQSSSVRWLRDRCNGFNREEYARVAEVLRWFLGPEYVLFSIFEHGTKDDFRNACAAGHKPAISSSEHMEQDLQHDVSKFYDLFHTFAKYPLDCLHSSMTPVEEVEIMFRGMVFPTQAASDDALRDIRLCGVSSATSFTRDALVALNLFSNIHRPQASVLRVRMERCGYAAPKNTVSTFCIFDGFRPLDLSNLAIAQSDEGECWLRCNKCSIVWSSDDEAVVETQLAQPLPGTGRTLPPRVVESIVGAMRSGNVQVVVFRESVIYADLEELASIHGNPTYEDLDAPDNSSSSDEMEKLARLHGNAMNEDLVAPDDSSSSNEMEKIARMHGNAMYDDLVAPDDSSSCSDELETTATSGVVRARSASSCDAADPPAKLQRQLPIPPRQQSNSDITQLGGGPADAGNKHTDAETRELSIFDVCVRADKSWETVEDREARLCRRLASRLRRLPTLPADPRNPREPWTAVESGVKLPVLHCAFQGCMWSSPLSSRSHLQTHLAHSHSHEFLDVFGEEAVNLQIDRYSEAIASLEREKVPVVGYSIDRRAFSGIAERFTDEKLVSRICFVCAQVKTDTACPNSDIEMCTGQWLKTVPPKKLAESLDYETYQQRFGTGALPLLGARDSEQTLFADWSVQWDASETEPLLSPTGNPLKLLCCPEDLRCPRGCEQVKRICSQCKFPICRTCMVGMRTLDIVPAALGNDLWLGYLQDFIYRKQVRWIECACASAFLEQPSCLQGRRCTRPSDGSTDRPCRSEADGAWTLAELPFRLAQRHAAAAARGRRPPARLATAYWLDSCSSRASAGVITGGGRDEAFEAGVCASGDRSPAHPDVER